MKFLSQHVDTFKESLYLNGDCFKFNQFVNHMIDLKSMAQEIHDINNDNRFIDFIMGDTKFRVMAVSVSGYSVVLKNGDISIALRKKGDLKTDKNPQIKIEYRASFLVSYGIKEAHKLVNDFIQKYIHQDYISKVPEIHVCADIQGYNFSLLDVARFKTRSRKIEAIEGDDGDIGRNLVFSSRRLETLYFGGSALKLRIYDKTREIAKHPDSGHIERLWRLNPDYQENEDVWRVEFQVRRDILKTLHSEDSISLDYTLNLLDNLPALWQFFINHFSYRAIDRDKTLSIIEGYRTLKDGTEKLLTKSAVRGILKRSEIHPLWNMISHFHLTKPSHIFRFHTVKASSPIYAMNSVNSLVSTITKHYGYCSADLIYKVVNMAESRSLKNHDETLVERSQTKLEDYFNKASYQASIGLDVVPINDSVKDNLPYYCADAWDSLYQIQKEDKK